MATSLGLRLGLINKLPLLNKTGCESYSRLLAVRKYAVKKLVGKMAPTAQKARLEVETDPENLLSHCCGANIYQEGVDPEIKSDSEYPEWLWTLRTDRLAPPLSELDPDTKYYWRRLHRINVIRNKRISKHVNKLRTMQYPDDKI